MCQRIMAFLARQCVIAFALGMLLFCISCEKHPLGQMPDVQREQPDPAKEWSEAGNAKSGNPASSPVQVESSAHEGR